MSCAVPPPPLVAVLALLQQLVPAYWQQPPAGCTTLLLLCVRVIVLQIHSLVCATGCGGNREPEPVEYDLDNEDEDWLKQYNLGRSKLSDIVFERMLWRLEVECAAATDAALVAAGEEEGALTWTLLVLRSLALPAWCGCMYVSWVMLLASLIWTIDRQAREADQVVHRSAALTEEHGSCE